MKHAKLSSKILTVAVIWAIIGCTDTTFSSSSGSGGPNNAFGDPSTPANPNDANGTLHQPPGTFGPPTPQKGVFEFSTAVNKDNIWVVTNVPSGMAVYLITLVNNVATVAKTWGSSGTPGTGARTFVTDAGLLIGKQGGAVYLVNEKTTPEGQNLNPVWHAPGASNDTRMCMTSFKINTQSYAGVAWENASSQRMFTRFTMANGTIDFNSAQTTNLGGSTGPTGDYHWSYGCFTDQNRKYLWGGWTSNSSFFGVDLSALTGLAPSQAPNANHSNVQLGSEFNTPSNGKNPSYALAGDAGGNVMAGSSMYTYTHETRNNVVFGTRIDSARLVIAKNECFSTDTVCAGKVYELDTSTLGQLKPLSSFNDGRVVGLVRGSPSTQSQVYLIELNNPADISAKAKGTRLVAVNGDAYMYEDFTGYSLEARDYDLTVPLDQLTNFDPSIAVKSVSFMWLAQNGGNASWEGLTLEARCYQAGTTPPAFAAVTPISDAGVETRINVPSCAGQVVNRLDLRVRGTGGTSFTRTSQIKIYGTQ
jgi:hypothetical protein